MKFGIIGAGMIGRFHAQAIRDMSGGSLHSILDRNEDRASELA